MDRRQQGRREEPHVLMEPLPFINPAGPWETRDGRGGGGQD